MEEGVEVHIGVDGGLCILLYVFISLLHKLHPSPLSGYFPRLILLISHVVILGVLLTMHPVMRGKDHAENPSPKATQPPPPSQPGEGSVDWLANLQAIQNLMGAV